MTIIGITGGTGAGKTTALSILKSFGALVIDCDAVYHGLLETDADMLRELGGAFPGAATSGRLDRKALGAVVFHDAGALERLNAITHKYVDAEVTRRLDGWREEGGALAAVDAIALFESGLDRRCAITVGVTAPAETRIKRIMVRDGVTREYAEMRIAAQQPDSFYAERCDYMLHGDYDTPAEFEKHCREFFMTILGRKTT